MLINKITKTVYECAEIPSKFFLDDDENNYYVVPDGSELYYKIKNSNMNFDFIEDVNGNLIDVKINYSLSELRRIKVEELESFITNIRSNGIEYKDQLWSIDEECEKNLTAQITMLSFAPTDKVNWFSKSQVNELTINEFKELALVLSQAISNAKMKYYVYKNAIENATSEEELNAIVFE